jgi:hypothetical protein
MQATKRPEQKPISFQLSLRIRHPSMDPALISKELRIEPEYSFQAGQPRHLRSSIAPAAVHTESYWLAALNPSAWIGNQRFPEPHSSVITQKQIETAFARNLTWALSLCAVRLSKSHGALLHKIRADGGEISVLVTLSADAVSSFSLAPEAARAFGELGVTLEFEMAND